MNTTQTNRLRVISQADLLELDVPRRRPLLGSWLTERHPSLIYAQTGRGKSLFVMSLAIALAGGGKVYGWEAEEPRKVLYVDAEMDLADIKDRDRFLLTAIEGVDEGALGQNLTILARHHQEPTVEFPDIFDEVGEKRLLKVIAEQRPALVVLDNLSTLANIEDENAASAFNPLLGTLTKLRSMNCAVILVHHTGKAEGKFRGSSKLATTFESVVELGKHDECGPDETGFVVSFDDKFRGPKASKPRKMKVKLDVDEVGNANWIVTETEDSKLYELVRLVETMAFSSQDDLAGELGVTKGTISKWKVRAVQAGLISDHYWKACLDAAADDVQDSEDF
ncbi:MAG: AAA family ATPase [Pseudomonadota bacterium]